MKIETKKINGYDVETYDFLIQELTSTENEGNTICNWFNFRNEDIFYDNDCNEYIVQVNHNKKFIQLI